MPNPDGREERRPAVNDALETQLQHVERQAKFANDMVTALREEFAMLWAMPGRRGQIEGAEAFVAQVDALAALAGRYLEDLGRARGMPSLQAQRLMRMLDVNKLLERGRGVEGVARALRTLPAIKAAKPTGGVPPRRGSGPLIPPGRPGAPTPAPIPAAPPKKLTERLADMLDRYVVTEVVPQAAAAPPPPLSPAERRLRMFEAAVGLVMDVLADAGPRLAALRVAVAASDGSVDPWAAARQAGVPADLRELISPAAKALAAGPLVRRAAVISLSQWDQVRRLADGYQRGLTAARAAPLEEVAIVLSPYDTAKLKGLVVPLTNLHLTYRTVPALAAIFPPPVKRRMDVAVPPPQAAKPPEPEEAGDAEQQAEAAAQAEAEEKLSAEETSRRRMALILQWMDDPASNPLLQDETVIYRLIAEEREYQQDRVSDLGMRLRLMPPMMNGEPPARAAERTNMMQALEMSRTRQAQLQELLTYVIEAKKDAMAEGDDNEGDDEDQDGRDEPVNDEACEDTAVEEPDEEFD